jgi:hypothetical protein
MANAAEKVLSTMGFIRGPNMAPWVEDQLILLEQRITQWGDNDPHVWGHFKEDLDRAFKDIHTKDTAIKELMDLCMAGDELDMYNTKFNQLLCKCGWTHNEQGTMQLYQ